MKQILLWNVPFLQSLFKVIEDELLENKNDTCIYCVIYFGALLSQCNSFFVMVGLQLLMEAFFGTPKCCKFNRHQNSSFINIQEEEVVYPVSLMSKSDVVARCSPSGVVIVTHLPVLSLACSRYGEIWSTLTLLLSLAERILKHDATGN